MFHRFLVFFMHLSLAFPGVDPRDTHGEPPGTRGICYIFDNFLSAWGEEIVWFWKRMLQTPGMLPPDLAVIGQRFSKSRMNSLPPFVFHFLDLLHVCSSSCRCTKPGMFYEEKRKSVIADSFDEFLVKGELNFKMMEPKLTKTLLVHSILEAHLFAQWETKTGRHQLPKRKAILQEDRRLQ